MLRRLLSTGVAVTAIVLGVLLAVANPDPVRMYYYLGSGEIALSLALAGAFAGGAVLGIAVAVTRLLRLRWENIRLRRELTDAEVTAARRHVVTSQRA